MYNFQKSRYVCISFLSCPVVNNYQLKRVIESVSEASKTESFLLDIDLSLEAQVAVCGKRKKYVLYVTLL